MSKLTFHPQQDNNNRTFAQAMPVAKEEAHVRADFIKKTYLHVALAVLGFLLAEVVFFSIPAITNFALSLTQGYLWLVMLGGFMLVTSFADRWAHKSTNKGQQYAALGLYVIAEAFIFIPLLYIAMGMTNSSEVLAQAGIITLALFTGLTAVVFFTGKDFSFLRTALTVGFFVAIGLIVASILFGFNLGLIFSAAMVVLAGGSILYQTSNVLHHYNSTQHVAAALGLFASLMLLFWYILRIVMSFND